MQRTLRPPKPTDGGDNDAMEEDNAAAPASPRAAAAAVAARAGGDLFRRRVDGAWAARLASDDPVAVRAGTHKVEVELSAWVDAQIIKLDDAKWGNRLSSKLFVGRDYVVKHIRSKHPEKVEAERERVSFVRVGKNVGWFVVLVSTLSPLFSPPPPFFLSDPG